MPGPYDSIYTGPQSGGFPSYPGGFSIQTGGFQYQPATGFQLSVGEVLEDFGDWIKTTAGEVLRVVVDEFGRRIVQKTGEVLAQSPLGPVTAGYYARGQADQYLPLLIGGGLLLVALMRR